MFSTKGLKFNAFLLFNDGHNIDEIAISYLVESIDNVQQTIRITIFTQCSRNKNNDF